MTYTDDEIRRMDVTDAKQAQVTVIQDLDEWVKAQ